MYDRAGHFVPCMDDSKQYCQINFVIKITFDAECLDYQMPYKINGIAKAPRSSNGPLSTSECTSSKYAAENGSST